MLRHLLFVRGRGWSQAGLEPATPGLSNRRNPSLRHLLCFSEATGGEVSELHRSFDRWLESNQRLSDPESDVLNTAKHSSPTALTFSFNDLVPGGKGKTDRSRYEISASLANPLLFAKCTLCELRLRTIINDDATQQQDNFDCNDSPNPGLGREPDSLPRGNALQVILALGEEFRHASRYGFGIHYHVSYVFQISTYTPFHVYSWLNHSPTF